MVPPGDAEGGDWFVEAVDAVVRAGERARALIEEAVATTIESKQEWLAGERLEAVLRRVTERGGRERTAASVEAFREFERSITALRAAVVRTLVDVEGMTFAAVAPLMGVSRQSVAVLYRRADG